jgi:hypothetical protein
MIVVCELQSRGSVKQHEYPDFGSLGGTPPPWGTPLEWAMRIAGIALRDLRHPCWIERSEQPASRITLELAARRQLRWSRPEGTH